MKKAIAIVLSIMLVLAITFQAAALSTIAVKSIKLNNSKITLKVGETSNLKVTFTPANTSQKKLTYVTGDKYVATIDATGKIKGVHGGTTTIYVYSINKKIFAKCSVTVSPRAIKSLSLMAPTQWLEWAGSKAVIDYFNNSKSQEYGAKLELIKVPEGDQGIQVVAAKFAAGDVPDLLFWFDTSNKIDAVTQYAEMDPKADWTKNFGGVGGDLNQIKYMKNGKLYGVPFGESGTCCVFYNKKVFANAGVKVPKTWDEFLKVCDAIKAKGVVPMYYSGKDAWTLQMIPIFGWGYGALEPYASTLINDLETNKKKLESLDYLKDSIAKTKELLDKGYVQKTWLSDTYDQAQQALVDGKAGMYPNGTWIVSGFIKNSSLDKVNSDIGAFAMPLGNKAGIVFTAPSAIFVPKNGQNVELAKNVATYFGTVEAQNQWFNAQPGIPYIRGISARLQGPYKDLNGILNSDGKFADFGVSAIKGYGWNGGLDKDMQDLLVGVKTPEQVLQALDVEWAKQAKSKNDPDFK